MQGEETMKNITPDKVVLIMGAMRHYHGSKFFKPHKFIKKDQTKSLFSRMLQQQKAGKIKETKATDMDQIQ